MSEEFAENRYQIIHINSANRTAGTPGDFDITVPSQMVQVRRPGGSMKVEPIQAVINRSWYSVDDSCNTFLLQTNDAAPATVTIPIGFWNVNSFLNFLQWQVFTPLNAAWVVGWDPLTSRYKWFPPNDGNTYTISCPNYAAHLLGFYVGTSASMTYSQPLYSDFPVKMTIESLCLVHVDFPRRPYSEIDNLLTTALTESDIFIKIPISSPPFDNLVWRANADDILVYDLASTMINSFNVYLTDEYGRALSPAYDWTFSLKITYSSPNESVTELDYLASMNEMLNSMALSLRYLANEEYTRSQREFRAQVLEAAQQKSKKKKKTLR